MARLKKKSISWVFLVLSLLSLQCHHGLPVDLFQERETYQDREAQDDDYTNRFVEDNGEPVAEDAYKYQGEDEGLRRRNDPTKAEEEADLFEGDIEMDEGMKQALIGGKLMSRDAVVAPIYHWPKALMQYTFDEDLPSFTKHRINHAMDYISKKTCIRFKPHQDEDSYVKFFQGKGCYSRIGRDPNNRMQKISIGTGCTRLGTCEHEIMHALGVFHEHTRPDRDEYIKVLFEDIKPKHSSNFKKYPRNMGSAYGKPYDENSVMHYSKYAFSVNGLPTILPLRDPNARIGQRIALSSCDIYQLNRVYCDGPRVNKLQEACKKSVRDHIYFKKREYE